MRTYRDCIQALLDGETLVSDTGVTVVLDSRGNPIISSGKVPCLYFTIPSQWSILKPEAPGSTPHPHAELMALYAKDAAETDRPWERWEAKGGSPSWLPMRTSPSWRKDTEYRRKPAKVKKWQWVYRNTVTGETRLTDPCERVPRLFGPIVIVCRADWTEIEDEAGEEEYVPGRE